MSKLKRRTSWEPFREVAHMPVIAERTCYPTRVVANNLFEVWIYDHASAPDVVPGPEDGVPGGMLWLSIKRLDREPIRDWRQLQRIKNEVVGRDHEAVQLFPADARLVDTSNQFHLFVLADPTIRFPFGYEGRAVVAGTGATWSSGARQEPFDPELHEHPADAQDEAEADRLLRAAVEEDLRRG